MKRILKRILPFVIGGSVVVFAACQQDSQTPTEPGVLLQGRGGPPLKSQIEQTINRVWERMDLDRPNAHRLASEMFDAVDAGDAAAAVAAAEQLIALAVGSGADMDDVQDLVDLVSEFSGLPPSTVVDADDGGVVTDDPDNLPGLVGVRFDPSQLPQNVAVILELQSLPCHPVSQLAIQVDDCVTIRTIPELTGDFLGDGVLFAVCTDINAPNFPRLELFRSEGPADTNPVELVKTDEETPDFIINAGTDDECQTGGGGSSTGSNWLDNFARAGWDKVGAPLASLFAPEPLHATAVLAKAGTLGGRTKNFSNFGWAEVGIDDGFEEESGWTGDGFWHRSTLENGGSPIVNKAVTDNLVNDLSDGGAMPAPFGGNWVFWYGEEADGNYIGTRLNDNPGSGGTSTTPNSGTLTSRVIFVPDEIGENAVLRVDTWFEIESNNPSVFDIMEVFVDEVGGGSTSLGVLNPPSDPAGGAAPIPFTSDGFNVLPVWFEVVADMNTVRGKSVRLRFEFDTRDQLFNGFRGWLLDNVRVAAEPVPAISAVRAAGSSTGGLNPPQPARPRD